MVDSNQETLGMDLGKLLVRKANSEIKENAGIAVEKDISNETAFDEPATAKGSIVRLLSTKMVVIGLLVKDQYKLQPMEVCKLRLPPSMP